jgi:hypothetical protein
MDAMPAWRVMAAAMMVAVSFAAATGLVWVTGWRGQMAGLIGVLTGYGLSALAVWLLWSPDAPAQMARLWRRRRP